jgi:hypothetical protein
VWAPDSASVYFLSADAASSADAGPAQLQRVPLDGGKAVPLTGWDSGISAAFPLSGGTQVAVLAAAEPTTADKRRKAARDDAVTWDERFPPDRLWLLGLATGDMTQVEGLAGRHTVELTQRPDGGPMAVISWPSPEIDTGGHRNELHLADPVTGFADGLDTGIYCLNPEAMRFTRLALLTGDARSLTASRSGERVAMLVAPGRRRLKTGRNQRKDAWPEPPGLAPARLPIRGPTPGDR